MSLRSSFGAFLKAPSARRRLVLEAVVELALARLLTLMPARVYTRALGRVAAAGEESPAGCPPVAGEIGRMVERVAAAIPLRARCLEQAIAARRMLRRRGLPATVCLGVNREASARADPRAGEAAHAWVSVGREVVAGDADLARFAVVARFR